MAKLRLIPKYQVWVDARQRYDLSDRHIQMARELGLDPNALDQTTLKDQPSDQTSLIETIETLYRQSYKKDGPDTVRSIEEMVMDKKRTKAKRKARNRQEKIVTKFAVSDTPVPDQETAAE